MRTGLVFEVTDNAGPKCHWSLKIYVTGMMEKVRKSEFFLADTDDRHLVGTQ